MNKRVVVLVSIVAVLAALAVVILPNWNNFVVGQLSNLETEVRVAFAQGNDCETGSSVKGAACHDFLIEAVSLPDNMYAYRMVEHFRHTTDGAGNIQDTTDLTANYSPNKPSVPGPTIVMIEGDEAFVKMVNRVSCTNFPDGLKGGGRETPSIAKVGIHVHGVHYSIVDDGTPEIINKVADEAAECDDGVSAGEITYHWTAAEGTRGTWPYHDHTFLSEHGAEGNGLFGTVLVDGDDEPVKTLIGGEVVDKAVDDISKEFVMWMVSTETLGRSVFYGMEIDREQGIGGAGKQTPLWVNPTLLATQDSLVRIHVLGMGDDFHSFHLHAHRWIEHRSDDDLSQASNIIDTREIAPLERHVFAVQAGEGVGPGDWMYHCHVTEHMHQGMSGLLRVLPGGQDDTLPPVGAVFTITDEPGRWFKTIDRGVIEVLDGKLSDGIGWPLDDPSLDLNSNSRSFAVILPGETVLFNKKDSITNHTVTSLIFPDNAALFDRELPVRGSTFINDDQFVPVPLTVPGLYVYTCKIHPYMFGGVIVEDTNTPALDLGTNLNVVTRTGGLPGNFPTVVPSLDPLALTLLQTFFVVTDPTNWKDYTQADWNVSLPTVDVQGSADGVTPAASVNLSALNIGPVPLAVSPPNQSGIGEVWIDTQFELTMNKNQPGSFADKPGTITVVDTKSWDVERKISLPEINMNHPHNMWADVRQDHIYQTQWFDRRMAVIGRDSGELVKDIGGLGQHLGESPSHVMTSPAGENAGQIYVAINGQEQVTEIDPDTLEIVRRLSTGVDSHPHGHWITSDGQTIVTPNFYSILDTTGGATIFDLQSGTFERVDTGQAPIATGMMPDGSKFYTANFLGNSLTCISLNNVPACRDSGGGTVQTSTIDLLAAGGGGLPIPTPVSPDGKWMVTAETLFSLITVLDTSTDTVVKVLPCDPGCHGVQWGAQQGNGYYAYVTNKFSNAMIVVDPDPNNNGDGSDAVIAGNVLLAGPGPGPFKNTDDRIIGNPGMGGQGVLAVPNVYNGWIQATVDECLNQSSSPCSDDIVRFLNQLNASQKDPS